jgi:hypothetical protein
MRGVRYLLCLAHASRKEMKTNLSVMHLACVNFGRLLHD